MNYSSPAQHADAEIRRRGRGVGQRPFETNENARIDGHDDGADHERGFQLEIAMRYLAPAHGFADDKAEDRIGIAARGRHALHMLEARAEDIGNEKPILVEAAEDVLDHR